jgi:hypothetical protein
MKKLLIFVLAVVSLGVAQQQTGGSLTAARRDLCHIGSVYLASL